MSEPCLVTGAEGFIGSHVVEGLVARGHKVRAMALYNFENRWGWLENLDSDVLDSVEIVSSDIRDPFATAKAVNGCARVFHLAALIAIPYSYVAPDSYVSTNIVGTLNVLQACLDAGVERLVHTSTSETYGTAQYTPIDEKHPLVGQSPYAASKIAADKLAESYFLSFGLPVATIRPFNTYGPRQSARAVIPTIISQALAGADEIRLGALDPVRDLTFAEDTASAFIAMAEADEALGKVTNVGSGKGITIGDLASLILEICGSSATVTSETERLRPAASEVRELLCDNSLARARLGWKPKINLRTGLGKSVDWISKNLDRYKPDVYTL